MPDGSEKPIGYASHSLSRAERNYSQLEREGLACVFGVKCFHSYLFGHPFELLTDNQPLTTLLNECRDFPSGLSMYQMLVSTSEYTIHFRKTQAHGNVDALSRLPLPTAPAEVPMPAELVLLMEHLEDSPVTAQHIRLWTRRDPVLSVIQNYVRHGWPDKVDSKFTAFTMKREELSLHHAGLHLVGKSSGNSQRREGSSSTRVALWSSRNIKDESPGQDVCLVARH